jgi:hypothetical protein
MTFRKWVVGILMGSVVIASAASATTYKCNIRPNSLYRGVSPVLVFSIDEEKNESLVYDVFIKDEFDKPIEAEIVVANDKRYTIRWTVNIPIEDSEKTKARVDYRATYIRRTHRISVRGFPKGYHRDIGEPENAFL